jgi:hypothetical protein
MRGTRRRRAPGAAVLVLLAAWLAAPRPAAAVEYRLRVVSVHQEAFSALLEPHELADGAAGPGLERLEASLDGRQFPMGAILWDRAPQPVAADAARAYGAVAVRADASQTEGRPVWHEVRWDGRPGDLTVWRVAPSGLRIGELERVALRGRGPLRQYLPLLARHDHRRPALSVPLLYLWAQEDRGRVWSGYLSRVADLAPGIAAVVGVNANRSFPDQVYLLVRHDAEPTTYKAILSWRPRDGYLSDLEAPGVDQLR